MPKDKCLPSSQKSWSFVENKKSTTGKEFSFGIFNSFAKLRLNIGILNE